MLEVETASDPINIQQFSHQLQSGADPTDHGGEMDLAKIDTTSGDELIAKGSSAHHRVHAGRQELHQTLLLNPAQIGPTQLRIETSRGEQMQP